MIRLQAAKMIPIGLNLQLQDGTAIHFDTYEGKLLQSRTDNNNVRSEWQPVGWKDVLKFIRENHPQRDEECCNHKYEVWDDSGRRLLMKVKCVNPYPHFHCSSCDGAENAIECCTKLCFECEKKSDEERRTLTNQILTYEGKFGVKFKEIQEWRDQYEGVYDYETSRGGFEGREDFHADG